VYKVVALPSSGLSGVALCWLYCLSFLSESRQVHLEVSKLERQEQQMRASVFLWLTNKLSELPWRMCSPWELGFQVVLPHPMCFSLCPLTSAFEVGKQPGFW